MKVYRGIKEEYQNDFKRNFKNSFYLNCFTFWASSKEYAKSFGSNILEKDIDPSKFFDLDNENEVDEYNDYFNEDIAPAEQNINFALFLALMGYDGYTRIDSDDGTITDESNREYVVLNKNDKELLEQQHNLVDYNFFTEEACIDYIYKLMWKTAEKYDEDIDNYCVPEIINEHLQELGLDELLEIDPDYAGKSSISSINENYILELAEKLRNTASKALNESFIVKKYTKKEFKMKKELFESILDASFGGTGDGNVGRGVVGGVGAGASESHGNLSDEQKYDLYNRLIDIFNEINQDGDYDSMEQIITDALDSSDFASDFIAHLGKRIASSFGM